MHGIGTPATITRSHVGVGNVSSWAYFIVAVIRRDASRSWQAELIWSGGCQVGVGDLACWRSYGFGRCGRPGGWRSGRCTRRAVRQLARRQQPDRQLGVTTIDLHAITRRPGDLARRRDHAPHAAPVQLARQAVAGRPASQVARTGRGSPAHNPTASLWSAARGNRCANNITPRPPWGEPASLLQRGPDGPTPHIVERSSARAHVDHPAFSLSR